MANDIPDLSGADFRDAGAAVLHTGAALAGVNANANPDEAARAAQLGAVTGVPSNVIHLDPKAFEAQLRQRVTQGIVGGNESLAHYAGSDPMASIVSNDDWGTLDTLSGKLHALRQATDVLTDPFRKAAEGLVSGGLQGLREGWGEAPPVTGEDVTKAIPALDPNRSLMGGMENTLLSSVMNAAQLGLRGMSSLFEGTTGAIGGAVGGLAGEAAGREAKALAEYEMMKPEQMPGGPWLMAGHEPPAGISKDLDKAKVERNETLLKGLEDAAAVVQQSKTWERSPELFKQFVQQHLGDRSISIAGDAVTALYGKEVPAPNDGKLGWVPNIASKVLAAAVDGSDVEVPLADWLTHMDPAVAKGLHDNVRMWPEGVTKAEAGVERQQVPPPAPEAVSQVRAAGGLEPVFRPQQGPGFTVRFNEETSQFLAYDAAGKEIGHLDDGFEAGKGDRPAFTAHTEVEPEWQRKGVATEMYRQFAERHEGNIRPAGNTSEEAWHLWRARYPEKMDAFLKEHPEVMEGVPEEIRPGAGGLEPVFRQGVEPVAEGVVAETPLKPEDYTRPPSVEELDQHIEQGQQWEAGEAKRLFGDDADAVHKLIKSPSNSAADKLDELIHDKYGYESPQNDFVYGMNGAKFFDREGMRSLRDRLSHLEFAVDDAAEGKQNTLDKELSWVAGKLPEIDKPITEYTSEERIAALSLARTFERANETGLDLTSHLKQAVKYTATRVGGDLEDTKALLERLSEYVKRYSSEGTVRGEKPLALPAPGRPESVGAARSDHPMIIGLDTIDPKAVGLPEGHWQKLQELAQAQYEDDMSLAQRRADRQAKQRETAEWKANRKEMQAEVEAELRAQPHVAADLFLGSGELNGEKLQQRFTLREGDLNDAQKAALPSHYVSKNGLGVDDVASLFGYGSGDSLVDALAAHHALKAGRSAQEMLAAMVKGETDRRMEAKYGDLPSNILTAAHDQALSETTLNLVTQEYQGAAMSSGVEFLKDQQIREEAKRIADGISNKDVNSRKKLAEVSKNYSDAVKGLLEGDPQATVVALQRRAIGAHVARELLDREKFIAQTEALMKKLAKWKEPGKNEVKTVDPEYINWAHVIMQKVGQKIRRSTQTLLEDIAGRHDQTLESFVASKQDMLRPLDVWPELYSAGWKKDWKQLDGEEARAVGGSLRSLDFHGRDELKVERAGEKADRDEVIGKMVEQTKRFERLKVDLAGNRTDFVGRMTKIPRQFMVNVLQMETFLNYMDKFDPRGTWSQYVMRGLVDGSNQADAWAKEFTKHLADANDGVDLSREVDNPLFRVPYNDGEGLGPTFRMTRENLRMVLLNAGNSFGAKSNLAKMAKGYGLTPEEVMGWLHQHATKEDWDWAQKVWDNVFERMWGHGAAMYRSLTGGVTPERVRIDPIQTRFGEYRGGYMPVDYHPKFLKRVTTDLDTLQQSNYHSALPQASWAKERTGASGPINLDMSRLPMLITRELHDIAMRPSLIQASKLLLDSRVRDAVSSKMGPEYPDMFKKYLIGVANRQNYLTQHPQYANSMLETLRKNLVTGLVGFNPGTVMKHAPTAFVLTAREIGPQYMLKAYKALYSLNSETSQAANDLVMSSHEIMRRDRNWEETLYGEMLKARPGGKSETWTNQLAKYSAKPVAWSDMFSAKAAYLGAYMKAIDEGYEHGDAVYLGERAVRRAHGSTSLTNRPQVMRDWNPWFTSVYTFFNDIVNRQMEMAWRAGEMLRDRKEDGGWEAAKTHVPAITASLFAAVIAPAIIEELVSPSGGPNSKDEGLGTKIVKDGFYTLSSGLPGVREFVHGLLSGTDATPAGLWKTAATNVQNVYRDVFTKKQPLSQLHAQRMIKDAAGLLAMTTGKVTQSMGNVAAFGYGVAKGNEHPKDPWGWLTGLRYGTLKGHSAGWNDWLAGKSRR